MLITNHLLDLFALQGDVMDTSEDVLSGPNGTTIRILPPEPVPVTRPELVPATVVTHLPEEKADDQVDDNSSSCWSVGRAGMRYLPWERSSSSRFIDDANDVLNDSGIVTLFLEDWADVT